MEKKRKRSKQTNKSDHPEPSTERGGSVGRKKTQEPKCPAQSARNDPNPDLKIEKTLEATQGERRRSQDAENTRNNPRGKLRSRDAENTRNNPIRKTHTPRRRNYQKQPKEKTPEKRKTVERGGGV